MTDLASVARAAVLAGGDELRKRYRADDTVAEYRHYDVKAEADRAAEDRMVPVVRQAFPTHAVYAEEAGSFPGDESTRWIIDPLDGTNNFAAGLPTFASSIAVLKDGDPELATVYLPLTSELYFARAGDGVRYQGDPVRAGRAMAIEESTVAFITGRDVPREPELQHQSAAIVRAVGTEVKRIIESWAPTVHSGLFSRGRIQGLVEFHPDTEEQPVTELFAREADGVGRTRRSLRVAAGDPELLDVLWEAATAAADGT